MTSGDEGKFDHRDNDSLMDYIHEQREMRDEYTRRVQLAEDELVRRMTADAATVYSSDEWTAEIKRAVAYDPQRLLGLFEFVPQSDLITAGAFIPAHEEVVAVPDKWNGTKIKPFAKRGRDAAAIIEAAKLPGPPKLVITRKEPTT